MYKKLSTKIKNIIKQAYISLVDNDENIYPIGQASFNGKASKFTTLSVYVICSNPPLDSHILLFSSQGQESVKFGIINDFLNRKKGLKEGEVCLFNSKTKSYILLKQDGSIVVFSDNGIDILGDFSIMGDLFVSGDITAKKITVTGDVVANGVSLKTHKHSGVTIGAGVTGPTI